MTTSDTGKTWMSLRIRSSTIGPRNIPFGKSALFAVVGSSSCRNMTNAIHAQNESNEDWTDDSEDLENDLEDDLQQDPQGDDWIDREDFYDDDVDIEAHEEKKRRKIQEANEY